MIDIQKFVIEIKQKYIEQTNDTECVDLKKMITVLDTDLYNWFDQCTVIVQRGVYALITYSLIKGGETDLFSNPNSILRNCRGTVINMQTCELVLLPFQKFFNINEIEECSMKVVTEKIKHAKIIEITDKLDGSMIAMRYYNDGIFVGSTGSLSERKNPRLKICRKFITDGHKKMFMDNSDWTFMFECILFKFPQIVEYPKEKDGIYLIGARNIHTGETLPYYKLKEFAKTYNISMTEIENHSLNEILGMTNKYQAKEKEGWVLRVDDTLYKMKCDDYLEMNKLLGTSPNVILRAWLAGVLDDAKAYYANSSYMIEYIENFERMFQKFADINAQIVNQYYEQFKHIKDIKDFAIAVKQSKIPKKYKSFVINKRNGVDNYYFNRVRYQKIVDFLNEHKDY